MARGRIWCMDSSSDGLPIDPTWLEHVLGCPEAFCTEARKLWDALSDRGDHLVSTLSAVIKATGAESAMLRTALERQLASSVPKAALADAIEGMQDMLPYVADYFVEKHALGDYITRAQAALGDP